MKKRIILGIGLLLILLPLLTPSSLITTNARPDAPTGGDYQLNDVTSVVEGQKLLYNISTFQYGAGIWDALDMLLEQVGGPAFDKGLIGSLEGSELNVLINAMDTLPLYKWNHTSGTYEPTPIWQDALSIYMYIKLNDELGAYANVSQFSFPDDFSQSERYLYNDTWPDAEFDEPILDDVGSTFWSGFNSTFTGEFSRGFQDANNSWMWGGDWYSNMWWNMPEARHYGPYDIYWFGYDLGQHLGYEIGFQAFWESGIDVTWDDPISALNGFYAGFFTVRTDGFTSGQADFIANKIPDKRTGWPGPAADVEEYAGDFLYSQLYERYYRGGFMYEGSLVNFNENLYKDLYDNEWDTFWAGYRNGYGDEWYWANETGAWDAHDGHPYGYNYNAPEWWDDPYNAHDEGYRQGAIDGYDQGYYDGYYGLNIGDQRRMAYWNWIHPAYYDGFANATIDYPSTFDTTPSTLPFAVVTTEYESESNIAYAYQYEEGYNRGYKYMERISAAESINWLWSNGPFYNMTLPDAEFSFLSGSILPIATTLTMLTDLDMGLMEYEFNWGAYDYFPFSSAMVPMQTVYAIDTNWTAMDEIDVARNDTSGEPGFASTWNQAYNYFEFSMSMNASEPGITMDVTWGYNTSTGLLLNITNYIDFYSQVDMWLDLTVELDPTSEIVYTPALPSPLSWSYFIGDAIFYYDLPPLAPTEFVDGVHEFKQNALASIGRTFLTVDMTSVDNLWGTATMTLQNPANLTDPAHVDTYKWPLFSGGGPVWLADWNYWDGVFTTANSVLGHYDYFIGALNALAMQNYNVDLNNIVFLPELGEYYHAGTDVQYYYVNLQAELDLQFTMLNGDFDWETQSQVGYVNATFYVGIDATDFVVIGGGMRAGFDFIVTNSLGYGFDNGGLVDGYIEIQIGSTYKAMLDLFGLIGHMFPNVPEYGIISMIGIIGLAAVASAVIFLKKKK